MSKVVVNGITYTEEDVKNMSKEEIKDLLRRIQIALSEISLKKQSYTSSNNEEKNSDKFWKVMNKFKTASIRLQQANLWIGEIYKQKKIEEHKDREHWFFTFFCETKQLLPAFIFNRIKKSVVDKCGFDIDIKEI